MLTRKAEESSNFVFATNTLKIFILHDSMYDLISSAVVDAERLLDAEKSFSWKSSLAALSEQVVLDPTTVFGLLRGAVDEGRSACGSL